MSSLIVSHGRVGYTRVGIANRIRLWIRPVGGVIWAPAAEGTNLVTTVGKTQAHNLLWGLDTAYFSYLALGSGTTTAAVGDTALESELARLIFTGLSVSGGRATIKVYFGPAYAVGTISEWGILNAATGGVLLSHGLLSTAITKTASQELMAEVLSDVS